MSGSFETAVNRTVNRDQNHQDDDATNRAFDPNRPDEDAVNCVHNPNRRVPPRVDRVDDQVN